ncbi:MFS transporter [Chloroflexota bacterium]
MTGIKRSFIRACLYVYNGVDYMSDSTSQGVGQGTGKTGRYMWIVLPLATGVFLTRALGGQGFPVLYPFIQNEFGLSLAQIGLITSAFAIGTTTTAILAGWLADTFGVKRIITISLLSLTAFTLAFPLAHSFSAVLALAIFINIVSSPTSPAMTIAVIDWFPARIRAMAMSIKQMGAPLAGALAAVALPTLALAIGWRMAAAVTGLLILAITIAFILLYRDAPRGVHPVHKFNLATLKTIMQNRGLVTTFLWGATFVGFQFIGLSYFMLFLIGELELSPIMAGGMMAIAQVSSIIARVLWGAISDFVFKGRRIVVLAITGFLTVLWMLGASLMGAGVSSVAVYLIAIAIGVSTLSFQGVLITHNGEQAEAGLVGVTLGIASTVWHVSMTVMPPLFGYLVDISGSYSLAWRVAAAVAFVITLGLLGFGRERQRR